MISTFENFNGELIVKGSTNINKSDYDELIDIFPSGEDVYDILYGMPDIQFIMMSMLYKSRALRRKSWYNYSIWVDDTMFLKNKSNQTKIYLLFDDDRIEANLSDYYSDMILNREGVAYKSFVNSSLAYFNKVDGKFEIKDNLAPALYVEINPHLYVNKFNFNTHPILSGIMVEIIKKLDNIGLAIIQAEEFTKSGAWFVIMEKTYVHG